jgi:hypothetical protein
MQKKNFEGREGKAREGAGQLVAHKIRVDAMLEVGRIVDGVGRDNGAVFVAFEVLVLVGVGWCVCECE